MADEPTHVTAAELEEESRKLKRLIDEAQRIDREITEHLRRMRQMGRPVPPIKTS